ncbi:hypothetical protein ACTA71_002900 [Dictyostelium dimigraforme]
MGNNLKKTVLKAGWVPGTETAIAKIAVSIVGLMICYYTLYSGYTEYQQIVEQQAAGVLNEVRANNLPLPPLETLTDIATAADKLPPQGKVTFLLDHQNKIITLLKSQKDTLSSDQKENLKEIINFLTQRIEDARTQANKIAMQDFIKELLKSAVDPFLLQAFGFTGMGLMGIIMTGIFVVYAMGAYEIHVNVIQKGTQMLLEAILGHEAGVNREVFEKIFDLFKTSQLSTRQQVIALNALMNNIIEYRDTHAISELEGKKLQQVADELRRLYEREDQIEKEIIKSLRNADRKSRGAGWVPGIDDIAVAKLIIGICIYIVYYVLFLDDYEEYKQMYQAVYGEGTSSNSILKNLTDNLIASDQWHPHKKLFFILEHQHNIYAFLNAKGDSLSSDQKEHLKEIVNFLTNQIENTREPDNKRALQDFIKECKKFLDD